MLANVSLRLNQASYQKTLEKGFAFVSIKDGGLVRKAADFSESTSTVQLNFVDGNVTLTDPKITIRIN
jgi:exonuclease VII large subunit